MYIYNLWSQWWKSEKHTRAQVQTTGQCAAISRSPKTRFTLCGEDLRSLAMEEWRQCGRWLIDCKVLPPNHRVVWPSAAVFDLAQALRDGVLLCQMLHNLSPGSVDLKEINFRPQMSQVSRPQNKPKNLHNDAPSLCFLTLHIARCVSSIVLGGFFVVVVDVFVDNWFQHLITSSLNKHFITRHQHLKSAIFFLSCRQIHV